MNDRPSIAAANQARIDLVVKGLPIPLTATWTHHALFAEVPRLVPVVGYWKFAGIETVDPSGVRDASILGAQLGRTYELRSDDSVDK